LYVGNAEKSSGLLSVEACLQ